MKAIDQFFDRAAVVLYRGSEVPIDHEDTAFKQQVVVFFASLVVCVIFVAWLLGDVPKEHEGAFMLPWIISVFLSYGVSRIFYVEQMHRLIEKHCPRSFTLAVAPAFL